MPGCSGLHVCYHFCDKHVLALSDTYHDRCFVRVDSYSLCFEIKSLTPPESILPIYQADSDRNSILYYEMQDKYNLTP